MRGEDHGAQAFALLESFARNRGRLLSRRQILAAVREYDFEGESNVVDVSVRYLRTNDPNQGQSVALAAG